MTFKMTGIVCRYDAGHFYFTGKYSYVNHYEGNCAASLEMPCGGTF